jgi:predicted Zn-dependent protease
MEQMGVTNTKASPEDHRILSMKDCQTILAQIEAASQGGGTAQVLIESDWVAGVRWGRNTVLDTAATSNHRLMITRYVNGQTSGLVTVNETSVEALIGAVKRAEWMAATHEVRMDWDLRSRYVTPPPSTPALFDDATYAMTGDMRVEVVGRQIQRALAAGLMSAGYLEVSAHSAALINAAGRIHYIHYTWAQCSVTVRDPAGMSSGWAGVDWPAWHRIDADQLATTAQEKCVQSRHPVRVEPGRYTTILEPQAVFDLMQPFFGEPTILSRGHNESDSSAPFRKKRGESMLGDKVMDPRLTIEADPMDPDLGFPPLWPNMFHGADSPVYGPFTLVKDGVLTALPYDRDYGVQKMGTLPQPWSGAFRMSGGNTSIAEMIASTERGILVTRFDSVDLIFAKSGLVRGYTRDGTWLIEHGAISKPITNLVATESVLFILNNIDQLGVPQRIFNPPAQWVSPLGPLIPHPAIVPSLKVREFSFTALLDAI